MGFASCFFFCFLFVFVVVLFCLFCFFSVCFVLFLFCFSVFLFGLLLFLFFIVLLLFFCCFFFGVGGCMFHFFLHCGCNYVFKGVEARIARREDFIIHLSLFNKSVHKKLTYFM